MPIPPASNSPSPSPSPAASPPPQQPPNNVKNALLNALKKSNPPQKNSTPRSTKHNTTYAPSRDDQKRRQNGSPPKIKSPPNKDNHDERPLSRSPPKSPTDNPNPNTAAMLQHALASGHALAVSHNPPTQHAAPIPQRLLSHIQSVAQRILIPETQSAQHPAIRVELRNDLLPDAAVEASRNHDGSLTLSFLSSSSASHLLLQNAKHALAERLASLPGQNTPVHVRVELTQQRQSNSQDDRPHHQQQRDDNDDDNDRNT